jgi:predicted PurR-regulated permease PerM
LTFDFRFWYNATMDKNEWKGYLRPRLILIAFGIALYAVLQIPNRFTGIIGWLWRVFSPIMLGLDIAFVLNVFLDFIERTLTFFTRGKLGRAPRRIIGMLLTVALMLGAIVGVLFVIIPAIGDTVNQVIRYLPQSSTEAADWAAARLTEMNLNAQIVSDLRVQFLDLTNQFLDYLKSESFGVANIALNVTTSILDTFLSIVLGVIFAMYILASKEKIGRFVNDTMRRFMPARRWEKTVEIAHLSFTTFASFVKGQLLEACILGMLCFIGMMIFRFPNPAVISLLIGVTALIPILGAWIGAGVAAFLIVIVSPVKALLFLVFILVLQQIDNNFIYPRVVGTSVGLPGVLVLAAITVGGNVAGVIGMLVGVPLCSVLYILLKKAVYAKKKPVEVRK